MTGAPGASNPGSQAAHEAAAGRVRETSMTRIYLGVILVQALTTLALLWLESAYTK